MDKQAIRKFAVSAREKLLMGVKLELKSLQITENGLTELPKTGGYYTSKKGILSEEEQKQYQLLKNKYSYLKKQYSAEEVFEQLAEETAYTWFNRLIAIRYMELQNLLPIKKRLLSSVNPKQMLPDALVEIDELMEVLALNPEKVWDLKDNNQDALLFRYLFFKQCEQLGEKLPNVFPNIEDIHELLFSENLLQEMVQHLLQAEIPVADFQEVELLGWLFQYYNAGRKEEVGGMKNRSVEKKNLPVVTQLFTPKWIVRYLLENSLGRIYYKLNPKTKLLENWSYFMKVPLENIQIPERIKTLEDIKLIDPACGSGHILVQAFDMLFDMYEEMGYPADSIPKEILSHNLFGLEIDQRAMQISQLVLFLKVLENDRHFLKKERNISIQVYEWQEPKFKLSSEALHYLTTDETIHTAIRQLEEMAENAKQFGSLMCFDESELLQKAYRLCLEKTQELELDIYNAALQTELSAELLPILEPAIALGEKYDLVITNPPYLRQTKYDPTLKKFMNHYYAETKTDLFAAFIEKGMLLLNDAGYVAMMTPNTWMFISTHEKLRNLILNKMKISGLVQLNQYAFFEDATVSICAFILNKSNVSIKGTYIRLEDFKGADSQPQKLIEAIARPQVYYSFEVDASIFNSFPNRTIVYWVSDKIQEIFASGTKLNELADPKQGLATADNNRFLRQWFEVSLENISFQENSLATAEKSGKRWFPYNKGGKFAKWYGNNDFVVNWEANGKEIRGFVDAKGKARSVVRNAQYYFSQSISWSKISSGTISFRYKEAGHIFDVAGTSIFGDEQTLFSLLGFLNTKVAQKLVSIISPTLNYEVGHIASLPIKPSLCNHPRIPELARACFEIAKQDWDSFEISWDFQTHPFLQYRRGENDLAAIFQNWQQVTDERYRKVKQYEEELNRLCIQIYDLQDELTPEVPEKEITIRKADESREVRSFLSYLIGILLGRYALHDSGVYYGGGSFEKEAYPDFQPDEDNIIPITSEHYFEDDIITRIEYLLVHIFGEEQLEQNLRFIADVLECKKGETSRERVRRYFQKEFYKDHLKTYQNRPIYWQFTSGKNNAFQCLCYLHRYEPALLARIRTDYALPLLNTLEKLRDLEEQILTDEHTSGHVKVAAKQKSAGYLKQMDEIMLYAQLLDYMANQHISIYLDDGVLVNYAKFQQIELPGTKKLRMNLLEKI
ncbi:BREX-1 system adenine-specific DNA-methyltransferase PglX [Listeria costaricensis]|uniref:BREX-1 system adenine-specific DNA-methyltransferase PglX n=1 Tax=Listeria costaricensis TaxID=2026604 RepID=UPI000C077E56|nr:BREX-1 system adenine-specific DNA-methyltransferase PglX [Listeria costaricensis]